MLIKLIQPKLTLREMDSEFKRAMAPSMALITLASLTPEEHQVIIEDENIEKLHFNNLPGLVGVTINVDASKRAYQIASKYREIGVKTIAGGIHASACPEEVLCHFDSVCIGEAEEIWEEILNDCESGRLKKRYESHDDMTIRRMPIPIREFIKPEKYLYTNTVFTGRGCPHNCEFCYNSCEYITHKTRNRDVESVIKEVRALGTKHIMFIDDNFIGNPSWTKEFLHRIIPLKLVWNAAVSTDIYDKPDLLDLMKESGCKSLFIGFESINPDSINAAKKKQNKVSKYEALIRNIHERGIMINASLVFGFDHDKPDVFKTTLDWLVENKIETMTAHILTPYPGTVLYDKLLKENRITDFDLAHYNTSHVVFKPKNMTSTQLKSGYLWMYKELYSFKNIFKRLPDCKSQRIPYLLFSLIYRKFGKTVSFLAKFGFMQKLGRWARRLSYNI